MAIRKASAEWKGNLKDGAGRMKLGSAAFEGPFSFASRFESGPGTNPEELLGAAQAGCYSMFLSALLTKEGFVPESIQTTVAVHLGEGPTITLIELNCTARVPGVSQALFQELAEKAKNDCPVSKALAGPEKKLTVTLVS